MKQDELRKIIKEEIKAVLNEGGMAWGSGWNQLSTVGLGEKDLSSLMGHGGIILADKNGDPFDYGKVSKGDDAIWLLLK